MLDKKCIRQFSQIGMRGTFGQCMFEMAQGNPDIMVISADLGMTSGLSQYMDKLPKQFLNIGIAEQNMIGVATGLALKGYRVFATSFAPFATARCLEQIRNNLGEMKVPVVVVGIASGFEIEQFGNSHYGYDDISYMRTISGITVLSPADTTELAYMLYEISRYDKPVYLRLTKASRKSLIYKDEFNYKIGRANIIKDLGEITIISTGSMVSTSVYVSEEIEESCGIKCGVVDMHTIKPVDEITIKNAADKSRLLVTLEEHMCVGGIGSVVAEIVASQPHNCCLRAIGVTDEHPYVGDYDYLMKSYGLDKDSVVESIIKTWNKIKD